MKARDKSIERLEQRHRITSHGKKPSWAIKRPYFEYSIIMQAVRNCTGLTQEAFSKEIGMSRIELSYLESGVSQPYTATAEKIAKTIMRLLVSLPECLKELGEIQEERLMLEGLLEKKEEDIEFLKAKLETFPEGKRWSAMVKLPPRVSEPTEE